MFTEGNTLRHGFGQALNQPMQSVSSVSHLGLNASDHFLNELNSQSDWRKAPRTRSLRVLVRKRIAEILKSKANHQWQQQASNIVLLLENQLFEEAISEEDYMNQDTLRYRLQSLVQRKIIDVNVGQQQPNPVVTGLAMPREDLTLACHSNEADTSSNCFDYNSTIYNPQMYGNIDQYGCQMDVPFNPSSGDAGLQPSTFVLHNGFSNEGLLISGYKPGTSSMYTASPASMRQIANETVFSPDMSSTITTCSSRDGFGEIDDSDRGSIFHQSDYPCRSEASFGDKFQERHLAHANVSQTTSEFLPGNEFGMKNSTFGDSLQYWPPMLEQSQQKPPCQPDDLLNKSFKIGTSFFPEENVDHDPAARQMASTYSQFLSEQSHNSHVALESYGRSSNSNSTGLLNLCNKLRYSLEPKILLAYVNYKSSVNPGGDCVVSFVNHLHSTVCTSNMCMCGQYCLLLAHFDDCRFTDCDICGPVRGLSVKSEPYQNFEKATHGLERNFDDRDYDGYGFHFSEIGLPPAKRLKPNLYVSENLMPSLNPLAMENSFSSLLSKNTIASILSPLMLQPRDLGKLPSLRHCPESPESINSETLGVNIELLKNPTCDDQVVNNFVNESPKLNAEHTRTPSGEIIVGFNSQEERDWTSVCKIANKTKVDSDQLGFNSLPGLSDELVAATKEEALQVLPDSDLAKQERENELNLPETKHGKEMKPVNSVRRGVSLVETFTAKEIKRHLASLQQEINQSILKDEIGNKLMESVNENLCQLCASNKLLLAPQPIYCSCCGFRIKNNVNYYSTSEESDLQHCICTLCYKVSRGGKITFHGTSIRKVKLCKKKNYEEIEEPWVQCDKCKWWQHQICALFNDKSDTEGKAEYVCPKCRLEELESREQMPLLKATIFGAKDLPTTVLSDYIEQRLFGSLKQERELRARLIGKNMDEVPGAQDLVVRVVLSVNTQVKVNKQLFEFHGENYPAEFPYRSKAILLFQKIEGVDVCLFGIYVQEFGSECSHPNQRSVYISYLDSVKYFRPEIKAASGEALRTFVYHEILIGYLKYCKNRGFMNCYLWACPPLKGEDYILHCHPEIQKTPKSDKLRQWYHLMLRKAVKENIVVNYTNLYDHFFVPTEQLKFKITATRLPYFDGDYWSSAAKNFIKKFDQQTGKSAKVKKTVTKRTLKAMGHIDSSVDASKDILLMQKLGQTIFPVKEDLIVVHLQFVCSHCHEEILSGWRWACNQCKNFQLCERCHDTERSFSDGDTHTVNGKERHLLSKIMVDDVPSDTEDHDVILHNLLFENRHSFLGFCQKNHYQFDTLRRAKHSSMMILHHLHSLTLQTAVGTCNICHQNTDTNNTGFCSVCFHMKGGSLQKIQKSTECSSASNYGTECEDKPKTFLEELLDVLQHASQCKTDRSTCSYPNCLLIKKLFCHATKCTIRFAGGCLHCQKVWYMLKSHARKCRQRNCTVPRCKDLKKHAEMLSLQSETRWRDEVTGSVVWHVPENDISQ